MKKKGRRKSVKCEKCNNKFSTKPYMDNKYPSLCKDCQPTFIGA